MRTWKEKERITEYYKWIDEKASTKLLNCEVKSINVSGFDGVENFSQLFLEWLKSENNDMVGCSLYLICNEKINDPKSRVEKYKKCWGKIRGIAEIDEFELGHEFEKNFEDYQYYSGIAKVPSNCFEKALRLLDKRQRQFLLLISDRELILDNGQQEALIDKLCRFDKNQYIDYTYFFEGCIKEGITALRYGNVSGEAELAIIETK